MPAGPFPEDKLREVRDLPGNEKCCDCPSISAEWASVTNGTLLCLDCAGRHRSLGVQVSFVRSILMDSWTPEQIELMRQGGNQQIRNFFIKMHIENSPIETLYRTTAAGYYRDKLKERVDKVLRGEISGERIITPSKKKKSKATKHTSSSDSYSHGHGSNGSNGNGKEVVVHHHPVFGRRRMMQLLAEFGPGAMGMSVTKDSFSQAQVTKLVPGGIAQQQGVKIGDYVVAVAGKNMANYDEVMDLIPVLPRPLRLTFVRPIEEDPKPSQAANHSMNSEAPTSAAKHKSSPRVKKTKSATSADDNASDDADTTPMRSRKLTRKASRRQPHHATEESQSISTTDTATAEERSTIEQSANGEEAMAEQESSQSDMHEENGTSPSTHETNSVENEQNLHLQESEKDGDVATEGSTAPDSHNGDDGEQINDHVHNNNDDVKEHADDNDDNEEEEDAEDDDDDEEDEAGDDDDEEGDEEEDDDEDEFVLNIEPGMTLKVWSEEKKKFRTAVVKRKHRDETVKVVYRDGTSESHVSLQRIAVTQDIVERQKRQHSANVMKNVDLAFAAASMQCSYDEEADTETTDFVARADEDIESWIESDDIPAPNSARETNSEQLTKESGSMRMMGKDFRAVFRAGPMGFTLTKDGSGRAVVTKVHPGGQAESQQVQIGDIVVGVGSQWMHGYDDVMASIPHQPRPLTLVLRRKMLESVSSETVVVPNSLAGVSKARTPSNMSASVASAIAGGYDAATRRAAAAMSLNVTASQADYKARTMTTRRELGAPSDEDEFDVEFQEGDLGLRIEERAKGQAEEANVTIGCTIVGINGEQFISHAHSVSTLRHAKRPVRVRFRRCDA